MQYDDPNMIKVERADLRPGDLLYFGNAKKPTHVGLYIGDGKFLSATTYQSPNVHEDNLDEPYWSSEYVGGRRPR
jgi:cell wall-associated NlpC family hydrolase